MQSRNEAFDQGYGNAVGPSGQSKIATALQSGVEPLLSAQYVLGTLTPAAEDPLYNLDVVSPDVSGSNQGSSPMNV